MTARRSAIAALLLAAIALLFGYAEPARAQTFSASWCLLKSPIGGASNTWGTNTNADWDMIDAATAGVLNLSVAGSSNVVLTSNCGAADQERNAHFVFTGALTGNITVFWPNSKSRPFSVLNSTTGAFTLTICVNNGSNACAGTSQVAPPGVSQEYISDGTNIAVRVNAAQGPPSATSGDLPSFNGTTGQLLQDSGVLASGVVSGPASAVSGNIATFNGTTGKSIQDSGVSPAVLMPSGAVLPYAGASAPTGWLIADGSAVSRTTFAALFAVIGTTYGAGNGSTTFNLPDMRGRVAAGVDSGAGRLGGGSTGGITGTASLGASGGEQAHVQTLAELASHSHTINDPGHQHSQAVVGNNTGAGFFPLVVNGSPFTINPGTNTATTGITINNAGSSNAANVTPPTLVLNYIIKT